MTSGWVRGFLAAAVLLTTGAVAEEAHFRVTDQVVAPDPGPFSATIGGIGNGAEMIRTGSGFEPVVFRNWFIAQKGTQSRAYAEARDLTAFDQIADGALDGAEVRVYRIENGVMRLIRSDRVPEGGFHASGWVRALPRGRMIPARSTQYLHAWQPWERPGVPYHYAIRAVDAQGRYSAPSNPVRAVSPSKPSKTRAKRVKLSKIEAAGAKGKGPGVPRRLQGKMTAQGKLALSWTEVKGAAGYVLYRSDTDPAEHQGYAVDFSGDGPEIRKGDLVVLSKKLTDLRREGLVTNRVWGTRDIEKMFLPDTLRSFPGERPGLTWTLKPHQPGTPVEQPGETYLEVTLDPKARIRIGRATNAGTAQQFYPVLDPKHTYRAEVWMKADRPLTVSFDLTGFHARAGQIPRHTFRVGRKWRKYVYNFRPQRTDPGEEPGTMSLVAGGPGVLSVDNFRIYRADAPYLDLLPEDYARLAASGIGVLRTHATVKTRQRTYDLGQLTDPGGLPGGIEFQNSLPQMLGIMAKAGVDPWLQIEPHFSPKEWQGLVEYLAAPYDPSRDTPATKPWAAKRYAQGRQAPWVDAFDRIYFELANETWNGLFTPWIFKGMPDRAAQRRYSPPRVYGMFQDHVSRQLRSSPYWSRLEAKWITVIGGWEGREYGALATEEASEADIMTVGAYLGGWEARQGPPQETPQGYFGLMTHVLQRGLPVARRHRKQARELSETLGRPITAGTYEAGPGYILPGLAGLTVTPEILSAQERVMKSLAAGTATLDAFLLRARLGFSLQNFFTWGPGETWRSHAHWHAGGQDYPMWKLLSLYNREGTGDFLKVETLRAPRADLAKAERRRKVDDAPLVAVYATRAEDRLAVFVVSRRIPNAPQQGSDGVTSVTLDLPISRADRVRRFATTGRYDDNNTRSDKVRITEAEVAETDGLQRFTIPALQPGSTHLYVFEGISR